MTTAYLAPEGLEPKLQEELRRAGVTVQAEHGRLLIADQAVPAAWAANIWHDCIEWPVASIGTAARGLRDIQRNWAMYAPLHHRRAALIQERLPHVSAKPMVFPMAGAHRAARLVDPARTRSAAGGGALLVALSQRRGAVRRGQDRSAQPCLSQALGGAGPAAPWPQPGERCLDLGASPGGWTWVLANLGAHVDRRRQGAARSAHRRDVGRRRRRESAFAPRARKRRPGRLAVLRYRLLSGAAAAAGRALAGVGAGEELRLHDQVPGRDRSRGRRAFAAIPGAQVLHLHQNKHELTFMLTDGS